MSTPTKLTSLATAGSLIFFILPAFGQETTPPPTEQGGGSQEEMMRSMMQDMMKEMMQQRGPQAEDDDQTEGRPWRRWHDRQMGRPGKMGGFAGRGHGVGMKIAFAVIDADGNGTVTLQEAQDFQARIFSAVHGDKNGGVTMDEIILFRGPAEGSVR